jgi:hypothetical protein
MAEFVRSPITAVIWEIWNRSRTLVWFLLGMVTACCVYNAALHETIRASQADRLATGVPLLLGILNVNLTLGSVLLTLVILSYTEFNPHKGSTGFPHRLFVLPVTSFQLVAVPMAVAVAGLELVILGAWRILDNSWPDKRSFILIGVYMVLHQTILWTLSSVRALRLLVLGIVAIIFVMLPVFPFSRWASPQSVDAFFVGLAAVAFLTSWIYVARQRSGSGSSIDVFKGSIERLSDRLPRNNKAFRSAAAAQFWFEWRRSGSVLPALVAGLLLVVIGPLSWYLQGDTSNEMRILGTTLAMPLLLALPIGKAFSKPDFWSGDLSVPPFIAIRPLAAVDFVATKLKVAALSAVISWALVLTFLSLWLPQSAQIQWKAQFTVAALSILACVCLTWKFLVGNLWLGLWGNRKVFTGSALLYAVVPFGLIGLGALLSRNQGRVFRWVHDNWGWLLPALEWIAVLAVIVKVSSAVFFWRTTAFERVRQYSIFWVSSTTILIALAMSLDTGQLRVLLVLIALLVMPLARIGLASTTLARNRHR